MFYTFPLELLFRKEVCKSNFITIEKVKTCSTIYFTRVDRLLWLITGLLHE